MKITMKKKVRRSWAGEWVRGIADCNGLCWFKRGEAGCPYLTGEKRKRNASASVYFLLPTFAPSSLHVGS